MRSIQAAADDIFWGFFVSKNVQLPMQSLHAHRIVAEPATAAGRFNADDAKEDIAV